MFSFLKKQPFINYNFNHKRNKMCYFSKIQNVSQYTSPHLITFPKNTESSNFCTLADSVDSFIKNKKIIYIPILIPIPKNTTISRRYDNNKQLSVSNDIVVFYLLLAGGFILFGIWFVRNKPLIHKFSLTSI